jgi:hypothetical protein
MGSATDADEDAITGLIYLAELLDDDEVRRYAVKSIAAFVLEDLGLANPSRNSRTVPANGDIPPELRKIWLWRGGSCWGGYDMPPTAGASSDNRNLCVPSADHIEACQPRTMRPRHPACARACCRCVAGASHQPTSVRASGGSLRTTSKPTANGCCRTPFW